MLQQVLQLLPAGLQAQRWLKVVEGQMAGTW
jgi:hypothetical protein